VRAGEESSSTVGGRELAPSLKGTCGRRLRNLAQPLGMRGCRFSGAGAAAPQHPHSGCPGYIPANPPGARVMPARVPSPAAPRPGCTTGLARCPPHRQAAPGWASAGRQDPAPPRVSLSEPGQEQARDGGEGSSVTLPKEAAPRRWGGNRGEVESPAATGARERPASSPAEGALVTRSLPPPHRHTRTHAPVSRDGAR